MHVTNVKVRHDIPNVKRSVAYVEVKGENLLENMAFRRHRPWKLYRPLVEAALKKHHIKFHHLSWSQKAGCPCGCSPGFLLKNEFNENLRGDWIWVDVDASAPKHV